MSKSINCPACGAPLDYEGSEDLTITCPYCHKSVIVPEGLRKQARRIAGRGEKLQEIGRLARAGQKTEAIKLYRSTFGVGLKRAKVAVERIAAGEEIETLSEESEAHRADRVSATKRRCLSEEIVSMAPCWFWLVVIGLPLASILLPFALNFPAISRDVQSALASPTMAPTRTPTRLPSPTPPPGFASPVLKFGGKGTGAGLFDNAHGIAVDGNGNIYVADFTGGRVQVFDSTGKFITLWNVGNSKTVIASLAADRKGTVFVVAGGEIIRVEGTTGRLLGSLQYPDGNRFDSITATADGGLYAMWYEAQYGFITSVEGHRDDLVRFDADGKVTKVIRGFISDQTGDPEIHTEIAVDDLGMIYALGGTFTKAVFKFTPEGKYIARFGGQGSEPGQFSFPRAIAVDNQRHVYVADNQGIQVFENDGRYLDVFKVGGSLTHMVFNDKNELFVATHDQAFKFELNKR